MSSDAAFIIAYLGLLNTLPNPIAFVAQDKIHLQTRPEKLKFISGRHFGAEAFDLPSVSVFWSLIVWLKQNSLWAPDKKNNNNLPVTWNNTFEFLRGMTSHYLFSLATSPKEMELNVCVVKLLK